MNKRFSGFPEPQKLKNYDFLRFLGSRISNKNEFSENFPKCSRSPKMLKKQFKHIKHQNNEKTQKNQNLLISHKTKKENKNHPNLKNLKRK